MHTTGSPPTSTTAPGSYRTGAHDYRQTPNPLAVGMGLVTPEGAGRVVASVVADLETRDRHHNVGHIGSRYLMPVLSDHGYAQLADLRRSAESWQRSPSPQLDTDVTRARLGRGPRRARQRRLGSRPRHRRRAGCRTDRPPRFVCRDEQSNWQRV
ncbi:MAG TPA: hypothetical protein VIT41_15230 [Microlunatus sp.]